VAGTARFDVTDPATGLEAGRRGQPGRRPTPGDAIAAADKAWPAWRAKTAKERAAVMMKWFALLHQHADDLARIMTAEQGKPLAEAGRGGLRRQLHRVVCRGAKRIYGETIPTTDNNKRYLVIKQPIGVCAAITPWNFPDRDDHAQGGAGAGRRLPGGHQAGRSDAAVGPGGGRAGAARRHAGGRAQRGHIADAEGSIAVGKVLCASDTVRHLSFTGSTEVGRILAAQCAPTIKKLSLELGGNAPFIVFDDADLDSAVEGAMISKYRNAGQTCVCANRFYVQAGVYDRFVEMLAAKAQSIKVGNGFETGVSQGPLIDDQAIAKVEAHVADALAKGAKVVVGGHRAPGGQGERFYTPTVLSGVTGEMLCAREETFGPVAPVFRFETEAEAVALANATEFGLASYFFSRDIGRIFRVGEALEYGMVGINTGLISTAEVPFGGVKQSGLGREGAHQGIDDYVELKYLCLGDIQR
jgi:succinate-semialdehyde dehydrogenase/glutarate-semialdehyde dehydrogenase